MNALKGSYRRHAAIGVLATLLIGSGAAQGQPAVEHLAWSQPPVETDPTSKPPVYCGPAEPAYAIRALPYVATSWTFVADDFRCLGNVPVTSIHWWGSYRGWAGEQAPRVRPESWRIGFWSHAPADQRCPFSRPNKLLWVVNVPAAGVEETQAGATGLEQKQPDTTFEYRLKLQPQEHFRPSQFPDWDTRDSLFWISITAVYTGSPAPHAPWAWQSRPQPWGGGAVKAQFKRDDLRAGFSLDPSTIDPITNPSARDRQDTCDMAFELDTASEYVVWEQPFTGPRDWAWYEHEESLAVEGPDAADKWSQPPDAEPAGIDVDMTRDSPVTWPATICADDFECRTAGPITGITLWTSWYQDLLPSDSAENVTFTLSIRRDIPAGRGATGYSMPGEVLWRREFSRGQFTIEPQESRAEGYHCPANGTFAQQNHRMTYKYTFQISPDEAFQQTGTEKRPVIYWLAAQARVVHAPGHMATRLGWQTSVRHCNEAAAWVKAEEPYGAVAWEQSTYPKGHALGGRPIDLAFAIETRKGDVGAALRRMVADDWTCRNDLPVTGLVWWGAYPGYSYVPCDSELPAPPDYFLLSIWSDVSDPDEKGVKSFSHPGTRLWEYRAETFDEVLAGFQRNPNPTITTVPGFAETPGAEFRVADPEPVCRYTVRLPPKDWFRPEGQDRVYWLSIVAVYQDAQNIAYPWGWTNQPSLSWDRQSLTPLAWWKLDEGAGKVAADSVGASDGIIVGNPVWQPSGGWIGGALDFDGRRDYILVDRPKGFDFAPKSFSAAAWVCPRETRGQWHTILEYDRDGINRNRFGLWLDVEGRFHFRVGWNTWHSQQSLVPNQWCHVAGTYDAGTRTMSLYVNGVLDGAALYQKGFATPYRGTLIIGARGSADGEFFNGLIDDVRVFDAALAAEDMLMLAGAGGNSGAVAAQSSTSSAADTWNWTPLLDRTGRSEDLSFLLFTEPPEAAADQAGESTDTDDGSTEIVIPPIWNR
jgi:hypothetical protein